MQAVFIRQKPDLIPVNPIKERDYVRSESARICAFQDKLEKYKINNTIRREMGRDIDGAHASISSLME